MEGGGIKYLLLDQMQHVEGDLELEKITEQNTRKNRHVPFLNSDLETENNAKLYGRNLRRVRFSESCIIIPCGFDVSSYAFRKVRADTPFCPQGRTQTRPLQHEGEDYPKEMSSSPVLSLCRTHENENENENDDAVDAVEAMVARTSLLDEENQCQQPDDNDDDKEPTNEWEF